MKECDLNVRYLLENTIIKKKTSLQIYIVWIQFRFTWRGGGRNLALRASTVAAAKVNPVCRSGTGKMLSCGKEGQFRVEVETRL